MALFKIFKGKANALGAEGNTTALTKEGYAYFTPDDGKFYIDVGPDNQVPVIGNRVGELVSVPGYDEPQQANRICINQRLFNYNDYDILDCGTAFISTELTTNTVYFDCGSSV